MKVLLSALLFLTLQQGERQAGVEKRGDHVMGFSHEAATHHFRLLPDGGEIAVTANNSADAATREQIRTHLLHITQMFGSGNFRAPMLIHDTNAPGVATMTRLHDSIRYQFIEIDTGATIRITASAPDVVDAVHAFLLFQIIDHHTGDSPAIAAASAGR